MDKKKLSISKKIKADPSKSFFIDMLTRDIGIIDCILDLVDNSIDSFVRRQEIDVMDLLKGTANTQQFRKIYNKKIEITISKDNFKMRDDCGGITVEEARTHVFRFGKPKESEREAFQGTGLSVYGIGMKRAFFKLGKNIKVKSQAEENSFVVDINVDEWEKQNEWDFEFESISQLEKPVENGGTEISITNLNKGVSERFSLTSFENELKKRIESTYALFLLIGVEIIVNDQKAESRLPSLSQSEEITPARTIFTYNDVETLLIAGISPKSDTISRGWYVLCNGRMILEANKDERTGWGNIFPKFHYKYNHFVGIVYFRSTNVEALPWTTTKDGIEIDSEVYQHALTKMRAYGKPITNFLNNLYPSEIKPEGESEREVFENSQEVSLRDISKNENTFKAEVRKIERPKKTTIAYSVLKDKADQAKKCFNKPRMTNKELGERTFEYFLEMECES